MSVVYVSGPYTARQLLASVRAVEDALMDEIRFRGPITDRVQQSDWNRRLQEVSHGRNAVIFNTAGYPNIMVHIKGETLKELGVHPTDEKMHPAFSVNGVAIPQLYISKYEATAVTDGGTTYAVSWRGRDPMVNVNFDTAVQRVRANGPGWHLMTNAEWAFIALWCKRNGYYPRGNNYYGRDHQEIDERGEPTYYYQEEGRTGRVGTGTGPKESAAWSHDGTPMGIWDLNGNVWEWVAGMRLVDGEIQIIPDNNAVADGADLSASSPLWRAILPDGTLVAPGTPGTLKLDSVNPMTNDGVTQDRGAIIVRTAVINGPDPSWNWGNNYYDYNSYPFKSITADVGVTIPDILRYLAIFPSDTSPHGDDRVWVRNYGERLACRGGYWDGAGNAGVFALDLSTPRSDAHVFIGLRPAFVPM